MLKLYSYFRSTAAYRVRIALNLKDLDYHVVPVHLLNNGGEHKQDSYLERNPEGLVPMLETTDGDISQSLAIIEYLEEAYPNSPSLLPETAIDKAYVRGIANHICCDIHPLNNLRVLKHLTKNLNVSDDDKLNWYHHWLRKGLNAVEQRLRAKSKHGNFALGDRPGLADLCIVAQLYNAHRFDFELSPYPELMRIERNCSELPAFIKAHPDNQIDFVA